VFEDPVVSIGSSQREWAAEFTRFVSDFGGARLRGTVLTVDDALEQDFDVLVVDDIASYLTPRFVEEIRRRRRKVVGVYDPDQGDSAKDRLLSMGVDVVVDAYASPEELLAAIAGLAGRSVEREALPVDAGDTLVPAAAPGDPYSLLGGPVVVVGPDQAIDVALALADCLVGLGRRTALADLDTLAPSLAQRLGLEMIPNVLTALDSYVQLRGCPLDSFQTSPRGFAMLAGIPTRADWEVVSARDVTDLLKEVRESHAAVIVKVSPAIEDLAPITGRAGRNDVHRAVLAKAAQVVVVSESTPVAVTRLLSWIADARRLSSAPFHVVFHSSPRSVYQRGEVSEELVRTFVPASITWLPDDSRLRRAVWNGEMVPAGPYLRTARGLAKRVADRLGAAAV
jgi:MinD-like ATPase involved in chromosome partitioning or flagellar assembly